MSPLAHPRSTLIENHTTGGSVLLGDECGRLTAIGWEFDGDNVTVGKIDLNAVSPPTSLTYIDNGYVFVSSACGDSLLISLDMAPEDAALASLSKGKGKGRVTADVGAWGITLLPDAHRKATVQERWMNIAPVKDFAVVEEDDGRVVSGVGSFLSELVLTAVSSRGRVRGGKFQFSTHCAQRRRSGRPACR